MGAPCDNLIMTYGEDGWPNGCGNDSTNDMKCDDCVNWDGRYSCPSNDKTYYYRVDNGLNVGSYKPDMARNELQEWEFKYKQKYNINS